MEKTLKPLMILIKIVLVGLLWSIFFVEGVRVLMLENWHFDIFRSNHWQYAWDLWKTGWVIQDAKEWAFVLIIISFIPLWLTGWSALSLIHYGYIFKTFILTPVLKIKNIFAHPAIILNKKAVNVVHKKQSYKEVRPKGIRTSQPSAVSQQPQPKNEKNRTPQQPVTPISIPTPTSSFSEPKEFDHALFKFDDEDNQDFDFDFSFEEETAQEKITPAKVQSAKENKNKKPKNKDTNKKENNNQKSNNATKSNPTNSILEIIKQKGYYVLTGISIKKTIFDFLGISKNQICLCIIDREQGDWLADEERFNDEDPLWFSESSHRISPIFKLQAAKQALQEKLNNAGLHFEIIPYYVNQLGNIINAEDMFEIWDNLGIKATRIDRGMPKDLKLFNKALEEAEGPIDKDTLEKLKKIIRG